MEITTSSHVTTWKKIAILGSVEARWFLGSACYDGDGVAECVKHFIIGAKQGDKTMMSLLWKAYKDHNVSKETLNDVIRIHHDALTASKSCDWTRGEIMYKKAKSNKLFIGDLSVSVTPNF